MNKSYTINIKESKIGQIWSVKLNNESPAGHRIEAHRRYVQIVSSIEYEHGIYSMSVRPISFELQYQATDDFLIDQPGLFDNSFFIEYWNEQTINAELLDDLIGEFEVLEPYDGDYFELKEEQKEFRSREIENTAALRAGVWRDGRCQPSRFPHSNQPQTASPA